MITKNDLFNLELRLEPLNIPELGSKTIYAQEMTGTQRDAISRSYMAASHTDPQTGEKVQGLPDNWREMLVIFGTVDENRTPLFTMDDLPQVQLIPVTVLETIANAVTELSQIGTQAEEEAEKKSVRAVN